MDKLQELKKDIAELESLMQGASRQKVKDVLSIEVRKLVTEYGKLEESAKSIEAPQNTKKSASAEPKHYEVKISNYAWDQTDKFIKFYITLKNIQNAPSENVTCSFTSKSVELKVKDFENKDHVFNVKNLLYSIKQKESGYKIKTDMIIISLVKMDSVKWSHVTEAEKKAKEIPKMAPDTEKDSDPTEGIMSVMRNMYETGDDAMKRTIAQAWTDAQNKQQPQF